MCQEVETVENGCSRGSTGTWPSHVKCLSVVCLPGGIHCHISWWQYPNFLLENHPSFYTVLVGPTHTSLQGQAHSQSSVHPTTHRNGVRPGRGSQQNQERAVLFLSGLLRRGNASLCGWGACLQSLCNHLQRPFLRRQPATQRALPRCRKIQAPGPSHASSCSFFKPSDDHELLHRLLLYTDLSWVCITSSH